MNEITHGTNCSPSRLNATKKPAITHYPCIPQIVSVLPCRPQPTSRVQTPRRIISPAFIVPLTLVVGYWDTALEYHLHVLPCYRALRFAPVRPGFSWHDHGGVGVERSAWLNVSGCRAVVSSTESSAMPHKSAGLGAIWHSYRGVSAPFGTDVWIDRSL